MFNIGLPHLVILLVAGLFILGPERLPGAAAWAAHALTQAREYATGARQHLTDELGTDLDELRKPLSDLQALRGMTPRSLITKHLLDGDPDPFGTNPFSPSALAAHSPATSSPAASASADPSTRPDATDTAPTTAPLSLTKTTQATPFDADAT